MKPYRYTRAYMDRGKFRIEYRRHGKIIPLKGEPGTAEFQQSYDVAAALMAGQGLISHEVGIGRSDKPKAGSFRWLCIEYFKSSEFADLGPTTRDERRRLLEQMTQERATQDPTKAAYNFRFGDYPAAKLEAKHVRVLRDLKQKAPNAANHRIKALSVLFRWAIENGNKGGVTQNHARDVPKLKVKSEGHHTWTETEENLFKAHHPVGTMARLAFELFRQAGQRLGDVWQFGPHSIVNNGKLVFVQEKNRGRKPIHMELDILPDLQAALEATPISGPTFLTTKRGTPFASKSTFGVWFKSCCKEAGLPHCSAHGLRKSSATFHANNGASSNELMAIHGWTTLRMAETYVRKADQKKLASRAMTRVPQE